MVSPVRALNRRRLASILLVAVVGAAIVAPGGAAAASAPSNEAGLSAYEMGMVSELNADRTSRGLVSVRVDARLMAIARARSVDMVQKSYFSHVQPDGRNVFDILREQSVKWYGAGEIIAWNTSTWDATTSVANRGWMNSTGHRAIITSSNYNYVGVGLAFDPSSGKKMWTAVFIKGPDRTAAKATVYTPRVVASPSASTRKVKVAWTGYDPRLQVLTSGLRSYDIQRRVDGGEWTTLVSSTTLRVTYFTVPTGHFYEFRIAARDNAGNDGAWMTRVIDLR